MSQPGQVLPPNYTSADETSLAQNDCDNDIEFNP